MHIVIFATAYVVMLLWRSVHPLRYKTTVFGSDSTNTGLASLYPGQLFVEEFAVCALITRFGRTVLQLTLRRKCEFVGHDTQSVSLAGSVEYESVVPNNRIIFG